MTHTASDRREDKTAMPNTGTLQVPQGISNAFLMLSGATVSPPARDEGVAAERVRWAPHIRQVDADLARGDIGAMLRAWHAACAEALGSGTWEAMIAIGEAALRIGQSTGFRVAFSAKARQAYHVAYFRAHHQGSAEGLREAARCFAALGEDELAEQCRAAARRLDAGQSNAPA